ncbi:MAG: Mobile element protein [Nitrospira sp.]|jgi:transposase|nr:MAG: Mobile element protein [Nitrospira sp.]
MVYARRSRLSRKQQGRRIELFVAGATARAAAEIVGVTGTPRAGFTADCASSLPVNCTAMICQVRWRRMRATLAECARANAGRWGKVPVFGLLKRGGKVFAAIIPNARSKTLLPIIREQVPPDSIVYTDSFTAYGVLDVSEFHHRRVNHSKVFVTKRGHHINGIENFWNQAKRHLRRFNGLTPDNFYWFLKECEWCFNSGNHQQLLRQLKYWYKSTKH